jgi:hypothetical protein
LTFCVEQFPRVALFTAVDHRKAEAVIRMLYAEGFIPARFVEKVEYVDWSADYKDLNYVGGAKVEEIVLVDDAPFWVQPGQEGQHILIAEFDPFQEDENDTELQRVRAELEQWLDGPLTGE